MAHVVHNAHHQGRRSSWISAAIPAALICAAFCSGCDPTDESASRRATQSDRTRIVLLVGEAQDDPTWQVLQAAAARLQQTERNTTVRAVAPKNTSPTEQQAILEGVLTGDVGAVCVIASDAMALRPVVKRITTSGRPVITLGRDIPGSGRAVHCGPSEVAIGEAAAAACALALTGRPPTVMTLHGGEAYEPNRVRGHAFSAELPVHGTFQILKEVDCGGNSLDAANLVRMTSRNYPRVGCWVFFDDWALRNILPNDRLLPLGCRLVLCNGSPRYLERVRRGEIQAMLTYDFFTAIERGVEAAILLCEGHFDETTELVFIPIETITVSEVHDYERRWEAWRSGMPSPPDDDE